jgi:AraC-like DNA-binding protein
MPGSRVFGFADPYPYQATIRAVNAEVLPTVRGTFHADLIQVDLHRLWLQRFDERLPRLFYGPVNPDRAAVEFCLGGGDQPPPRWRGLEVSPGEIVVDDTDPMHRQTFAASHLRSMSLTPADLASAGRALVGRELARPSSMHLVRPAPVLMARLSSLHQEATQLAKNAPDKLTHPEVVRSLEEALVHAMIRCLTESTIVELDSRAQSHATVILKFEELLAANCSEPIYLSEVCAATGVSESTLRRSCYEHVGMGPVRYLWLRRMHLARVALLRADAATATVTGIATDHGFWELGRFSVDYRKLFGELPSATLRRSPQDRRIIRNRPTDLPAD